MVSAEARSNWPTVQAPSMYARCVCMNDMLQRLL